MTSIFSLGINREYCKEKGSILLDVRCEMVGYVHHIDDVHMVPSTSSCGGPVFHVMHKD